MHSVALICHTAHLRANAQQWSLAEVYSLVLTARLRSGSGMTGKICGRSIDGVCTAPKRAPKKHGCSPNSLAGHRGHSITCVNSPELMYDGQEVALPSHASIFFPNCKQMLHEQPWEKVVIKTCHFKANSIVYLHFSTSSPYGSRSCGVLLYFKALLCALRLAAMRACMPTRIEAPLRRAWHAARGVSLHWYLPTSGAASQNEQFLQGKAARPPSAVTAKFLA